MTHLELELNNIRNTALEMMQMVSNQITKSKEAMLQVNKELALEVIHNEKRVNGYELVLDNDCGNLLACFSPVAIDLRFILAILKINYHLERIGDNADGVSRNLLDLKGIWKQEIIDEIELLKSFEIAEEMMQCIYNAFLEENGTLARKVFELDENLDKITQNSFKKVAYFLDHSEESKENLLYLLLIHRKLERVGDLIKNIAEEIIFYLEAKVLKHKNKTDKIQD
jgi:phosphate transport system protein